MTVTPPTDIKTERTNPSFVGRLSKEAKQWTIIFGLIVAICAAIAGIFTVRGDWEAQVAAAAASERQAQEAQKVHDAQVAATALAERAHQEEWDNLKNSVSSLQRTAQEVKLNLGEVMKAQGIPWKRLPSQRPTSEAPDDSEDTARALFIRDWE